MFVLNPAYPKLSARLDDQLELAQVVDVVEGVGGDDDEVGELAGFDGAQPIADAA